MRNDAESPSFGDRLLRAETVLWWGRPRQGIMFMPRDGLLVPFSLLWGGFAIFWETTVLRSNAPSFFALWGIPFVVVGLFMIVGRFPFDAWLRSKIYYALTDRRILIARSGPRPSFTAISLDRLPEITLDESRHGRGTIRFGRQIPAWDGRTRGAGFGSLIAALDPTPQFLGIEDAKRVFVAIQARAQG